MGYESDYKNYLIDLFKDVYSILYCRMNNLPIGSNEITERDMKYISSFVNILYDQYGLGSIGDSFAYDYLIFQYDYWSNVNTKFGTKIQSSWVLGKKALKRWNERIEKDLYHAKIKARKNNITPNLLINESKEKLDSGYREDKIKGIYERDDPARLINCIENTTLIKKKSIECISCNFRKECLKILKNDYPKTYILRDFMK